MHDSIVVPEGKQVTDPVAVFTARAEARAYLWQLGKYGNPLHADSLHRALEEMQYSALCSGLMQAIGQDRVQEILRIAFAKAWPK